MYIVTTSIRLLLMTWSIYHNDENKKEGREQTVRYDVSIQYGRRPLMVVVILSSSREGGREGKWREHVYSREQPPFFSFLTDGPGFFLLI